jgi:hypothetical protein
MADFLTIDGDVYDVLDGGAEQSDPDEVGEEKRAIDSTLRSNVQASKRNYRFTLVPMTNAAYLALETKAYSGNFYACAGAAIAAHVYRVRIVSASYVRVDLTFLRAVQLTLRQQ